MRKTGFILILILFFSLSIFGYEEIHIKIMEVPYREPHSFLGTSFNLGGRPMCSYSNALTLEDVEEPGAVKGFALWVMSARSNQNIQYTTVLNYRGVDLSGLKIGDLETVHGFDIMIGGRFYPIYPTFGLSKMPVRLTLSAVGGIGFYGDSMIFSTAVTKGFVISSKDNPSGLTVEISYVPGIKFDYTTDYVYGETIPIKVGDTVSLQVGFLFAP
ncbi:MAG TPA: hypothetical protein ENN73_03015 [Firmicutes bacterium]|nr:hypothetical protein [Bacillota bacterium]